MNLIEVIPDKNMAVFQNVNKPEEKFTTEVYISCIKTTKVIFSNWVFFNLHFSTQYYMQFLHKSHQKFYLNVKT